MDGVELLKTLKQRHCLLPVILITGHADVAVAVQAMKAGASEFVQKPFDSELLLRLVRAAMEENDEAMDASFHRMRVLRRIESLTSRERQVLDMIMQGASGNLSRQRHVEDARREPLRPDPHDTCERRGLI